MSDETSRSQNPNLQVGTEKTTSSNSSQINGLLPGERLVSELKSNDGNSFLLTHARIIYRGGEDKGDIYASAQLRNISSVKISRRPRARRSAAWGIVGLFSAIGVWQVTPDSSIGAAAAVAVALVSLVLMGDYWIRPAGVHLEFHTAGGKIGGEVGGKISNALEFAQEVEDAQRRLIPTRLNMPRRNYPSG